MERERWGEGGCWCHLLSVSVQVDMEGLPPSDGGAASRKEGFVSGPTESKVK